MRSRLPSGLTGLSLAIALSACGADNSGSADKPNADVVQPTADGLLAHDPALGAAANPGAGDDMPRPVMQAQVVLERLGFASGIIDGRDGLSTRNAITGFQQAKGLPQTGQLDDATKQVLAQWNAIPATRLVTIPQDFAAGPFAPTPDSAADQARLAKLDYQSLDEKLAERFHTTIDTLKALNPAITGTVGAVPAGPPSASQAPISASTPEPAVFRAGQQIRVPNVGADQIDAAAVKDEGWRNTLAMLGVGTEQPDADHLVVSKSKGTLSVYNDAGKLIALFTATMGSSRDPLPLGSWKILGTSYNPEFHYNPKLFWDVSDKAPKQLLPPGPNGPVGVVWIDLNKPHYGIHGTPEPQTIGRAESHGCVRLTNWDVARLAQMVSPGTKVRFVA